MGKTFPAFSAHAHSQFYVSGKRPMAEWLARCPSLWMAKGVSRFRRHRLKRSNSWNNLIITGIHPVNQCTETWPHVSSVQNDILQDCFIGPGAIYACKLTERECSWSALKRDMIWHHASRMYHFGGINTKQFQIKLKNEQRLVQKLSISNLQQ